MEYVRDCHPDFQEHAEDFLVKFDQLGGKIVRSYAGQEHATSGWEREQLNALLADKQALAKVLTYHVVPGEVKAAEVINMTSAATVEGQSLTINAGDTVKVNNAEVIKTDILTSNGVIHVIDTVILPPDMVSKL